MKKCGLMAVLMVVMMIVWVAAASAACTYSSYRKFERFAGYDQPITLVYHCVADGEDTIDEFDIASMTGRLQHIAIVPTTGKEPTSVTPNLETIDGNPAYTASAISSPWTRQDLSPPLGFSSGLKVSADATCDATDEWDMLFTFL